MLKYIISSCLNYCFDTAKLLHRVIMYNMIITHRETVYHINMHMSMTFFGHLYEKLVCGCNLIKKIKYKKCSSMIIGEHLFYAFV